MIPISPQQNEKQLLFTRDAPAPCAYRLWQKGTQFIRGTTAWYAPHNQARENISFCALDWTGPQLAPGDGPILVEVNVYGTKQRATPMPWQEIASAPLDEVILVFGQLIGYHAARYGNPHKEQAGSGGNKWWTTTNVASGRGGLHALWQEPTHWMPLPLIPAALLAPKPVKSPAKLPHKEQQGGGDQDRPAN